MVRPAGSGLATAFFRLYLLDSLAVGPARPAALLAAIAGERLRFATGAFGRALQSLLEGGYITPAAGGTVTLTALGAAERVVERERWSAVLPTLARLLGETGPRAAPVIGRAAPADRAALVADAYLDRVLVAAVRERVAAARDGGPRSRSSSRRWTWMAWAMRCGARWSIARSGRRSGTAPRSSAVTSPSTATATPA